MCLNLITTCLFSQFIKSMCKIKKERLHVREDVGEHDIHCEPKSYKLKFLGKLVVQQLHKIEAKQWIGFQVNCFYNILIGI